MDIELQIEKDYKRLYGYALNYTHNIADAEDLLHDTLIKVLQNKDKYNSSNAKFATWVNRIMYNCFIDKKRSEKISINYDDICIIADEPIRDSINIAKIILQMQNVKHKQIMLLRYLGFKCKEIAKRLEMNENTVRASIMKSKERLRRVKNYTM